MSDPSPPPETPAAAAPAELSPAACAERLAALFPALFGGPPKPIKLRIQADIQQRSPGVFTRKSLSGFLHRHTTSTAYLKALAHSSERFDLDGVPAGELAAEHREAAVAELERRRAIFEARRQAERDAQRQAEAAARRERDAEFEARRERAALLRAFETTTLTRANFCALKGIAEAELEARLAQARTERAQRPSEPARELRPQPGERGGAPFERTPRPPGRPPRSGRAPGR
jgi:sRNA-binding protein